LHQQRTRDGNTLTLAAAQGNAALPDQGHSPLAFADEAVRVAALAAAITSSVVASGLP